MTDMKGRVCLVTGATMGIGKEAARTLAHMGAEVVLAARDEARAKQAVAEIGGATSYVLCDFASLASIRAMCAEVLARHPRLHVLLNNAGAIFASRELTTDGYERTFALNHLGYFLTTELLLDRLVESGEPGRTARIVNVASAAHAGARRGLDFDDLLSARSYGAGIDAYNKSKLANVMFTYELARRVAGTPVTANCLHPGVIASGFGKNRPGLMALLVGLASPFLWTVEKGARTSVKLASSPEVEGVSGKYFDEKGRERRSSRASYDVDAQRRLWEESERLVRAVG
jgi:NAD(P)-dependent dehydrogenase (short-subunit alcohol dehydrogenase family)